MGKQAKDIDDIHHENITIHVMAIANLNVMKCEARELVGALKFRAPNAIASVADSWKGTLNIIYKNMHWRLIELLVGSGAVDKVASLNLFPEYRVR